MTDQPAPDDAITAAVDAILSAQNASDDDLYALRAADPRQLRQHPDPVGPQNNEVIRASVHPWSEVVVAWGANSEADRRAAEVMEIVTDRSGAASCLGVTKAGYPRHPLYVRSDAELATYEGGPDER